MEKISGIYIIINAITGDFYIGSSKDVKNRWCNHKKPSMRKKYPNNQMYHDMEKYGLNNFLFQVLAEVEEGKLKEIEEQFIEKLKPTYNSNRAEGHDTERYKEYEKSDKCKKRKEEYRKSDKFKKYNKEYQNKYINQLCNFNGEILTLNALSMRFRRMGIDHPTIEAKKYLVL